MLAGFCSSRGRGCLLSYLEHSLAHVLCLQGALSNSASVITSFSAHVSVGLRKPTYSLEPWAALLRLIWGIYREGGGPEDEEARMPREWCRWEVQEEGGSLRMMAVLGTRTPARGRSLQCVRWGTRREQGEAAAGLALWRCWPRAVWLGLDEEGLGSVINWLENL